MNTKFSIYGHDERKLAEFHVVTEKSYCAACTHPDTKLAFSDLGVDDHLDFIGKAYGSPINDDTVSWPLWRTDEQFFNVLDAILELPKVKSIIFNQKEYIAKNKNLNPLSHGKIVTIVTNKGDYEFKVDSIANSSYMRNVNGYYNNVIFTKFNIPETRFCQICYGYAPTSGMSTTICWPSTKYSDFDALYKALQGLYYIGVASKIFVNSKELEKNTCCLSTEQCRDLLLLKLSKSVNSIKLNDVVEFVLPEGTVLTYTVQPRYFKISKRDLESNLLFKKIGVSEIDFLEKYYGYKSDGGIWPEYKVDDYTWFKPFVIDLFYNYGIKTLINGIEEPIKPLAKYEVEVPKTPIECIKDNNTQINIDSELINIDSELKINITYKPTVSL